MGLDMYLYLRKGESKFDEECTYPQEMKRLEEYIAKRNFKSQHTAISYQVGYWRKFNALHNWFVEQCANGVDECQDIYVSIDDIRRLIAICERVDEHHELAEEMLPTTGGFFFGSQEYDEWYFDDLKETIKVLKMVYEFLQENEDYDCIYQASW